MIPTRRLASHVLSALSAVAAVLVLTASPAAAHARLVGSEPAAGAVLEVSPPQVVLRFNEEVEADLGGITVQDASGDEVASGGAQPDPATVTLSLPALADGAYVVLYNVTSLDGHPVRGGYTFEVGQGGADTGDLLENALGGSAGDRAVSVLLGVSRWLSFVALAALVGGALFLHLWPPGAQRWPGRRIVWLGWGFSVVGAVAGWMLLGPYLTDEPLGALLDYSLWQEVYGSTTGKALAARVTVMTMGGLALPLFLHRAGHRSYALLVGTVTVAAAVTFAMAGHARTGRWPALGVTLDVAHVSAMALWFGGLVVLVAVALVPPAVDATDTTESATEPQPVGAAVAPAADDSLERAVRRFSSLAFAAIVLLVVTGAVQGWRIVEDLDAVRESTYGSVLIAKVVLVVAIVLIGWIARRAVRAGQPGRRSLRQVVGVELGVGAAVLALTAALIATSPSAAGTPESFSTTMVKGDVIAGLTIDPAAVGTSELHLVVTVPGGALAPSKSADVRLLLPERDLGPLTVALEEAGPNHWVGPSVQLAFPGEWVAEIRIVTFEGRLVLFTTPFTVE